MRFGDAGLSRRTFLAGGALTLAGATEDHGDAAGASERVSFTRHEVASTNARRAPQHYQRLGGGNNNLVLREFPPISVLDGDFSIRWRVRIETDQMAPPYFANFATIEVDDTGPGGRIGHVGDQTH